MYVEKNKFPRIRVNLSPYINLFFLSINKSFSVEKYIFPLYNFIAHCGEILFFSNAYLSATYKDCFSVVKITIFFEEKDGKQLVSSALRILKKRKFPLSKR